jgi:hypothetical protein
MIKHFEKYLKNRDLCRRPIQWAQMEADRARAEYKAEQIPDWVLDKIKLESDEVHWVEFSDMKMSFWVNRT